MGNSTSNGSERDPRLQGWQIKEKHNNFNIWRNTDNPKMQLEEYALFFNDERQFLRDKKLYELRKNSNSLVSSHHFVQEKQQEFCSSVYKGNIFLQRIPVKLSNVSDLPFPDALHVNKQALTGFNVLSQEGGFFGITEDHIGFTSEGVAKVWMNKDFEKTFPSQNVCKEEEMVVNILRVIDENTDRVSLNQRPSLFEYLYSNASQPFDSNRRIGFIEALNGLQQYSSRFNRGQIPAFMNCVRRVGTDQLMRQFTINQHQVERSSIPASSVPSSQTNLVQPIGQSPRIQNRQTTIINSLGRTSQVNRTEVNKQNIKFVPILQGLSSPVNQRPQPEVQSQRQIISNANIPLPLKSQERIVIQNNNIVQGSSTQPPVYSQFRPILSSQIVRSDVHRVQSPPPVTANRSEIHNQVRKTSFVGSQLNNQNVRTVNIIQGPQGILNIQNKKIERVLVDQRNFTKPISAKGQRFQQTNNQTISNAQQTISQASNSQAIQQRRVESLLNHNSIVATSQVIHNGALDSDRQKFGFDNIITRQRNADYYGQINSVQKSLQKRESPSYSDRHNRSQVPQISELSSIANQVSQKNKNYESQKPFSEIRGQSINNSTVNFYNSYMNKEDDSQAEWQDYTQVRKGAEQPITRNDYQQRQNVEYSSGAKHQTGYFSSNKNYKDGTSSEQFWDQLKNFKKFDTQGSQKTAAFGNANYQLQSYSYNSSNKKPENSAYEATYEANRLSYGTNELEPISSYKKSYQYQENYNPLSIQTTYSYGNQENVRVSNQLNYESENREIMNHLASPPRNLEDISHKVSQSPEPIRMFQAQSFGLNNQIGKSLEENLQMKYSMANQDEEYKVNWDPQILADLQNIQN